MMLRSGFTTIPTLYHFPLDYTGYATLITVFFGYDRYDQLQCWDMDVWE